MLSLGAAIGLYSRATQIKSAVDEIGSWLRYLSSQEGYKVRVLLERLQRRMDALQQPLSFCLMWCHDKGSCVSDVVFQARDVLQQAEAFIVSSNNEAREKLVKTGSANVGGSAAAAASGSSGSGAASSSASTALSAYLDGMVVKLEAFLVELEFAMSALNLALNVINASRGYQQMNDKISNSALLRASGRIRDMHNMSGDLTFDCGMLLQRNFSSKGANETPQWTKAYDEAALKVFHNLTKNSYELHLDRLTPLPVDETPLVSGSSSSRMKFDLDSSVAFVFTNCQELEITSFEEDEKSGLAQTSVDKGGAVFSWIDKSQGTRQFGFVLSNRGSVRDESWSSSFSTGDFRPVDVAYTIQLCIYENLKAAGTDKRSSVPFHVKASDEELWALFSSKSINHS
eukprot:TRINITY_DN2981_c0_g1_i1.p1 TRINITY_DN2981_c0_g1~~TRINITY_DN2981_c0_g1_i1.p1  ORF type:complete len:400 (-),score=96.78 TRINITY_DN2981_c0_g1_i1:24-1223(-)